MVVSGIEYQLGWLHLVRIDTSLPTQWTSHLSSAVFVLLPLFSLYLKLAYWRRTYGEHFSFALHRSRTRRFLA